ncbi:MAG: hypothetical protein JST68_15365, partial [Bacteroidetes bacterium]|nr:hypothetical protein [Bacteroidota bacterium]
IRFMYGLKENADPTSRTIVLMPCNDTSTDRHVPNLILTPDGYLSDTEEETITLNQCWDVSNRYVNRTYALWPEEARKDMPRACFFGITTLKNLLAAPGCEGIQYHFGYNPETDLLPNRYQAIMEAVDQHRQSLHIFVEEGQHCPPVCRTGDCAPPIIPVGWPFYNHHEQYEQVPEGSLYEMFHYVSPTLFEVIQDKEIFQQHFSECFTLAKSGSLPEARQALRTQLEHMMDKYLFTN